MKYFTSKDGKQAWTNCRGNRVQHALRAYIPREQSAVKAAAENFRQNPELDIVQVLTELKTDETLISFLDQEGRPLNC